MASDLGMSPPVRQTPWPLLVQAETPRLDCWDVMLPTTALGAATQGPEPERPAISAPFLQTGSQHKHAFNA